MRSILSRSVRCCRSLFKSNYLKNKKFFLNFVFLFWNLHQILNIFKKKKIVIANVLPNLQTIQHLVRALSKNGCFGTSFDSQHVRGFLILVKLAWEHFYHIFSSLLEEMIRKISPLLKFEILGVFVNTLTACSALWGFAVLYSNAVILTAKNFFSIFCSFFGIFIKF